MTVDRPVAGVVAIVVVTALLSGPLVAPVDLTGEGHFGPASVGEGTATVSNASMPAEARFTRGDFGADGMYLVVPPATVDVADVRGRVHISYQLSIEALGFMRGTTHFVGREHEGAYRVAMDRKAFDPDRLHSDRYDATLEIEVYDDTGARTIGERAITVEVQR
jgi:hypothetical protein